jgi:hypothetical protein
VILADESNIQVFTEGRPLSHWFGLVFYITTGAASIVGAVLSWQAWVAAISARDAARDAKRAVRIGNASEVLKELNQSALELLDFIQNDRWQVASLRARDLFSQVGAAQVRWRRFLDDDKALEGTQSRVRKISLGLTVPPEQEDPEVKQKLLAYCHAVIKALSDESSRIISRIEQAEEEHERRS